MSNESWRWTSNDEHDWTDVTEPCPFCGSDAIAAKGEFPVRCVCNCCGAQGPGAEKTSSARRLWNMRRHGIKDLHPPRCAFADPESGAQCKLHAGHSGLHYWQEASDTETPSDG